MLIVYEHSITFRVICRLSLQMHVYPTSLRHYKWALCVLVWSCVWCIWAVNQPCFNVENLHFDIE